MTQVQETVNWQVGATPMVLEGILRADVNIAVYERDISALFSQIDQLLQQDIVFKADGDILTIMSELTSLISPDTYPLIIQDIKELLYLFKKITATNGFRLYLATVNTNMCRKFHTDVNDLRMLCTYSGPGTLWLKENNVNRKALEACGDNACIVIDESEIQRAKTGAVVLLKGAIYPQKGVRAVVQS